MLQHYTSCMLYYTVANSKEEHYTTRSLFNKSKEKQTYLYTMQTMHSNNKLIKSNYATILLIMI